MATPALVDSTATHATRNPDRSILPPRRQGQGSSREKTQAEKNATALKQIQTREKAQLLTDEVDAYFAKEEAQVQEIADRTGYTADYVRRMLKTASVKRVQKREVSAHNAVVSSKMKELNKERPKGEKYTVATFAKLVRDDPSILERTTEEEEKALATLVEKRKSEVLGVRVSSRAVTVEGIAGMGKIADTIHTLNLHGGLTGWAVVTKAHVNDTFSASWGGTEGAPEFIKEMFDISMDEMLLLYELWECNRTSRPRTKNLPSLQKHCAKLVVDGLQAQLNKQSVAMQYKAYEKGICLKHHVKIHGWPEGVKFDSPYQIGKIEDLVTLRDALMSGLCRWVKIKPDEYKELQKKAEVEQPRARKTRSDKGGKRERDESEDEDEVEDSIQQAAKRKVATQKSMAAMKKRISRRLPEALKQKKFKSSPVVNSSDEESEGDAGEKE